MYPIGEVLLRRWHRILGLSKQTPPSWYQDRLREELLEVQTAPSPLLRLSEESDVFFSISRAQFDGFPVGSLPPFLTSRNALVYTYMLGKFTLRWQFYRTAAFLCGASNCHAMREVVNPGKDSKLVEVASRHQIDPVKFQRIGRRLRWVFPLLP